MGVAFVGRRAELEALTGLPRLARQARGGAAAVVTGAPGSGKTHLLTEVSRWLGGQESARLVGYEPVANVPLAAAGDLLRELGVLDAHLDADRKPGVGARRAANGAEPPNPDGESARDPLRIFEAAHRARIVGGPSVLVVDDLQWIDSLSLGLVHYLLRAAEASHLPLTVIAAARPSGAAAAFEDGVAALLPDERRTIIELQPLDLSDGLALARTLDPALDVTRATALWQRAKGSPFWLEALALGRVDDPSGVIRGRLSGIGSDAASLLAALAVGARPLAEVELSGVLEWPPNRVRHTVDQLILRGLVLVTAGGVQFAHDLIREAALADVPAPVVRRLHARIAAWIEADPTADLGLLGEALGHRESAGLSTADLAARVLASPRRRLLGPTGLRLIAAITDRLEPRSSERLALELGLAELATGLGEQETAIERWSRVSERASDPATRRRAELAAATAAYRLGRAAEARTHLDRARAVGNPGLALEADAATAIGLDALDAEIDFWLEHRTADGAAAAKRALEDARGMVAARGGAAGLTEPAIRAYLAALEAASDAATQEARMMDLLPLSREIEGLAGLVDDEAAYVEAATRVGSGLHLVGGSPDAERVLRRAWTLAKERVLPTQADEAGHWFARSLQAQGRLGEAHAVARETAELEARLGHGSRHWSRAAVLVHALELSLGDPRAALAALRADAALEPDRHHELGIRQTIAEWQARFSGPAAAPDIDAQLAEAHAAAAEVACPRCGRELAIVDAEIEARLGRIEAAERGLARWLSAGSATPVDDRWRHRAETALALARRDGLAAVAAAKRTIADAERSGRAGPELWARIDLGRAQELIDRATAVRAYGEAAAMAERMGARSEGRLVAGALRRLGVRVWRRGPDTVVGPASVARDGSGPAPETLSSREREIARWVADGATNAEIAEALIISPKTVERHLTNVFAKLGLRNRAELASWVRVSPDDRGPAAA